MDRIEELRAFLSSRKRGRDDGQQLCTPTSISGKVAGGDGQIATPLPVTATDASNHGVYTEADDGDSTSLTSDSDYLRACADALSYEVCSKANEALLLHDGFVKHQIESFEKFIDVILPHILREVTTIIEDFPSNNRRHVFELGEHRLQRPTHRHSDGVVRLVFPNECRQRQLTYAISLTMDITHKVYELNTGKLCQSVLHREVFLGTIPIPLLCRFDNLVHVPELCDECPRENGGNFIVSGAEKVIVAEQKMRTNYVCVFAEKQPHKFAMRAEVRSCVESKMRSTSTLVIRMTHLRFGTTPEVLVTLPFLNKLKIPLIYLYNYLGVRDRQEIRRSIIERNTFMTTTTSPSATSPAFDREMEELISAVFDHDPLPLSMTQDDLYEHLGEMGTEKTTRIERIKFVERILSNEFLPHISREPGGQAKVLYLSHAVHKLFSCMLGRMLPDDQDQFANKRVESCGALFALLFRPNWKLTINAAIKYVQMRGEKGLPIEVAEAFKDSKITSSFRFALSTGSWGVKKGGSTHKGVAQMHNRLNANAALSSLRRVNFHINKEGKMPAPRQLHTSSTPWLCFAETPDGAECGLVNNLALGQHLSTGYDSHFWYELLDRRIGIDYTPLANTTHEQRCVEHAVFVHGVLAGYVKDAIVLAKHLRQLRRRMRIPFDCGISPFAEQRRIELSADAGCFYRPLIPVECALEFANMCRVYWNELDYLWEQLLCNGLVEYVCSEEEYGYRIAMRAADLAKPVYDQAYTHVMIDTLQFLGACASKIPFMNRNQAPRNTYGAGMDKQSKSVAPVNASLRADSTLHALVQAQVPLVQTRAERLLTHGVPSGTNVFVAVMIFTGYNVEDGIIVNRSSQERGTFTSFHYQTYKDEDRPRDNAKIERPSPLECKGMRAANYNKLSDHGFVLPGNAIESEDVLIGKTILSEEVKDGATSASKRITNKRDASLVLKTNLNEPAVVDRVFETTNRDGARTVKVVTRAMRSVGLGDKLCSRHGQKGVVGMSFSQEDLPWVMGGPNAGMVPDVIINPHGMVSRMTAGQYAEGIAAKIAAAAGKLADGSPFSGPTNEEMGELLHTLGFSSNGKETMVHPHTGEIMEARVFFVPTYYMALKHEAVDKIHARATGPVQALSRQPVEGRSRMGGLRFGEMEFAGALAHGASRFLSDRLMEHSDPFIAHVCATCGMLAVPPNLTEDADAALARAQGRGDDHVGTGYCRGCGTGENVHAVKMPYGCKLFHQELQAANLALRFEIDTGQATSA